MPYIQAKGVGHQLGLDLQKRSRLQERTNARRGSTLLSFVSDTLIDQLPDSTRDFHSRCRLEWFWSFQDDIKYTFSVAFEIFDQRWRLTVVLENPYR